MNNYEDSSYAREDTAPIEPRIQKINDSTQLMQFPDGSALLGAPDNQEHAPMRRPHHDENVAEILNGMELSQIGMSLKFSIEDDIQSQEEFLQTVANIIKYLGITVDTDEDTDGLPFKGASSIYSPAMFESALDIIASAMTLIFPSANMVDTIVLGEAEPQIRDQAYRIKEFFNYYFDVQLKDFRKEAKRTIFWTVIAGSAYKKVYICPVLGRPVSHFIPIEDFIVNRSHSSHISATRKTHILRINEKELKVRKMSGLYMDVDVSKDQESGNINNVIQEELDQVSGYNNDDSNEYDKDYVIYECHVDYRIEGDPGANNIDLPLPYIVSLDASTGNILSIRRNWEEQDVLKKKREYFVNYSLLPSLDGEGYGFANYAGRSTEAATSLTRQLIDSGVRANFPGGVYMQGVRIENNNLRPAPGEFVPIAGGQGLPLSQVIMPMPYKEPSPTLMTLKNEIEDTIRRPSAIVNQKVSEIAPRAPQGSVLAILENLQKVPNFLMQGFHESFTFELDLFKERFAEWMPQDKIYPFSVPGGKHIVMKSDFQSDIQVLPSSDPSRKNSMHRFMLSEIIINNAKEAPTIVNLKYAFRYFFKNLGVPEDEVDQLLSHENDVKPPQPMDPVSTIMAITQGQPTTAAVWQNHDAYIAVLDAWLQMNPQNPNIQAATALKSQHEAMKYMVDVYAQLGMQPPEDPSQMPPEEQNQLAVRVATIKAQEAQEALAKQQPPEPPLDPARVMLEDSQMKNQRAQEKHEMENQIDMLRLELENRRADMEFSFKEHQLQIQAQAQQIKLMVEEQKMHHNQLSKEREQAIKNLEKHTNDSNNTLNHLNNAVE